MSSPATAILVTDPATLILTAGAIQAVMAARALQQAGAAILSALRDADNLHQQHQLSATQRQQEQAAADGTRRAALVAERQRLETRYASLLQRAQPLGLVSALLATRPTPPATSTSASDGALGDWAELSDVSDLANYVAQLSAVCQNLESALHEALGESPSVLAQTLASDLSLDDLLAQELQRQTAPSDASATTDTAQNEPRTLAADALAPATAIRLLARMANLGPLPEAIEHLVQELSANPSASRAQLLTLELRREIAKFEQDAVQKASALVLEHTLQELGYQVEPIGETLFVEGGIVHFRRQSWGNYLVRLRLDSSASAKGKAQASVNFNVIRAVQAGENERSVLDHLAEDRWCTEFPALLQALAARGLTLDVTREVAAGELPVQLVQRDRLPNFADAEATHAAAHGQLREQTPP